MTEDFTLWRYRGYTMAQLDEIIDFAKQQMFEPGQKRQMIRPYTPMQFIPPARHQYIAGNPGSQLDLSAFQIEEQATGDTSTGRAMSNE